MRRSPFTPTRDPAWFEARTYEEDYRLRATTGPLESMSGRDEAIVTQRVNEAIARKMTFDGADVVVDVGCGDGYLLTTFEPSFLCGVGVTATTEEAARLREVHRRHAKVEFVASDVRRLSLPTGASTKVVCNGVLLMLESRTDVSRALQELARIAAPAALVWVGEIPDRSESEASRAGASPSATVVDRVRGAVARHGLRLPAQAIYALVRRRARARARASQDALSRTEFFATPDDFVALAREVGLELVWKDRHVTYDGRGAPLTSPTRWDYLFRRARGEPTPAPSPSSPR